MIQIGLDFSPPRARRSDPDTSHAAARRAAAFADSLGGRALEALQAALPGGLTAPEIAVRLGARDGSISPRIKPLRKRGLVVDSGDERKGATVWMAC
jgi:hypothetical protein